MRARALRGLIPSSILVASATALLLHGARAGADPGLTVEVDPPARLVAGDRARILVRVRISPKNDLPVLLTPTVEGTAIEVVRGRMFRSDAEKPDADELRFHVPIVARTSGTSVLRVRVLAYSCGKGCRDERAEAALPLRVERSD